MKAFVAVVALLASVAAEPQLFYGQHIAQPLVHSMIQPYNTMIKPVEYKKVDFKPIEYKTMATPMIYNNMPLTYSSPLAWSTMMKPSEVQLKNIDVEGKTLDNALENQKEFFTPQYANKGMYVAESAGAVHIAKREAEPFVYNSALPYTAQLPLAHSAMPLAYSSWWNAKPLTYAQPLMKTPLISTPMIYKTQMSSIMRPSEVELKNIDVEGKTLDNALEMQKEYMTPEYANKGMYVAKSAGAVHIAKRDAESQFFYNSALPYTTAQLPLTYANTWANQWAYPSTYKTYNNFAWGMNYGMPLVY